jgi:hypothetical protein
MLLLAVSRKVCNDVDNAKKIKKMNLCSDQKPYNFTFQL